MQSSISDINTWRADLRGKSGALLMLAFAIFSGYRWTASGDMFFILLMIRELTAVFFFLRRRAALAQSSKLVSMLSYFSSALPLFYLAPLGSASVFLISISHLFSIVGFLIATLATLELGNRMAVSPAVRGERCRSGVYRYFRHPMYTGYVLAEFGLVLSNPMNLLLFAASIAGYWLRSKKEDELFG